MDKHKLSTLLASTALTGFAAASAYAGSSGSFTATVDNFNCTINDQNGLFNSSVPAGTLFEISSDNLTIQIPDGDGTAVVITPSLVTGLFTDNKITSQNGTSTQDVGIQVQVEVKGPGPIMIAPATPGANCSPVQGTNDVVSCVIYDQRFIQVSSSVFGAIQGCSTTFLTSVSIGPSSTMTFTTGSTLATCFELIESTLSAHAFNFYVQARGGTYTVDVDAELFVGSHQTSGTVAGCAGPGTVTVEQVKNFKFNTPLSFPSL